MQKCESVWSYISSSLCQEELTCLNLESVIGHGERRMQREDQGGLTTKKTAVHKHIYDSYCRVNKRTWCHQESIFWGNFINLQKKKKRKKKSSTWNLATTLETYRVLGISKLRPQHVRKCNLYFTEIETHTLTALCLAASAPVHQKGTSPVLTAPTGNSPMQHTDLRTFPFITSQHSGTPPGLHSPAACKSSHTNCYLLTEPFAELLHFRPVLQSKHIL